MFWVPVFSVASGAVVALAATGQTIFYPTDCAQRGAEIVNTFNSSSLSHATGAEYPQILFQTKLPSLPYTPYQYPNDNKGMISFVQSLTQTTHNTLLIVTYINQRFSSRPQYIVLPVEQFMDLVYVPTRYNQPSNSTSFSSNFTGGVYPYFSVDPKQRAADIVSAVNQLKTSSSFQRTALTQIWIQTNLSGPFNPQIPNGLLKNITAISVDNSLIRIDYFPPYFQQTQTVVVTPEQVEQVLFIYNYNTPNG